MKINGTLIILDVDGEPVTHVSDATLNINRELPDANDKDSAPWADHLDEAGLMDWNIDVDGNADWLEEGNVKTLFDLIVARTAVDIVFGPEEAGYINFTGSASPNGLELGSPVEETAPLSGTMEGKGQLDYIITS